LVIDFGGKLVVGYGKCFEFVRRVFETDISYFMSRFSF